MDVMANPESHCASASDEMPSVAIQDIPAPEYAPPAASHLALPDPSQSDVIEPTPAPTDPSRDTARQMLLNATFDQPSLLATTSPVPIPPLPADFPTSHLAPATAPPGHSSEDALPALPSLPSAPSVPKRLLALEPDFMQDTASPTSPLSSIGTIPDISFNDTFHSQEFSKTYTDSDLSDSHYDFFIDHDYDGPEGHRILRLKPTQTQWDDFPAILAYARDRGADDDGCFKVILPQELHEPLPEKDSQKVPANAYKPKQLKKNSFWRVNTVPSEGVFASNAAGPDCTATPTEALDLLRKMYRKNNDKQIRNVRYRVDVPAWTPEQRRAAGVPDKSPIYPLKGDKLDETRAVIPGIHTPYVYESGPYFGASFQIHAEDFRLVSLNHLYKGRKIWIVVPSTAVDIAEEALGRKEKCSQFMRHRAEFFFPQKLEKLGIPFRIVDQRAGETIVILPDAYHEGFSTGYTIAEAKNYADENWTTDTYQPCEASCQLVTAIPADLMRPLREGEVRLDLCASYEVTPEPPKRSLDESHDGGRMEAGDRKRVKA